MNIGEKIRELRIAKLMTQSDLAGKAITRNMLSCIENGTANPSLSTILYIAGRLNVPAGFLLAEEGDELVYRKMKSFANIKRAYIAGDYRGCRSLCFSGCPEPDDEISLLLSSCDCQIAIEEFDNGRLHSSCSFFDEALSYAEKTMYPTDREKSLAALYFRFMERISPTLYSDMLDSGEEPDLQIKSPFAIYVKALGEMENGGNIDEALESIDPSSFYAVHLQGKRRMLQGDFAGAKKLFERLLNSEEPLKKVEVYLVFCELEICSKELEDFKDAYRYANEKLEQLEQLLKDTIQ